ncbi:MAG: aminopeptidase [bacterium]|nr:aminopeptidase [bacterium]
MRDSRVRTLAHKLVSFSCNVQSGENVLIENYDENADELVLALIEEIYAVGAKPYVWRRNNRVQRALMMGVTEEQLDLMAAMDAELMRNMQAYILIRCTNNAAEGADIPQERSKLYGKHYGVPVHNDVRIRQTKWCYLEYPTPAQAQLAGMSTEAFENYYFRVCTMDYARLAKASEALKALIERTDKVHILGKGTDLAFSIKGIGGIISAGEKNIPDGEVMTAPVRESVNGVITYNVPSNYGGEVHTGVALTFENGRIVKAEGSDPGKINEILDRDAGARYIGEFAFGTNPYCTRPIGKTLYDEKIAGSFHFTPGDCYDEADNGNHSSVHWDLIAIQTPEYGGGEIWFDDVLIRKDGRFVLPELEPLNPENLMDAEKEA